MKEVTREKDNSQMVVTGDEPMGNADEVGSRRSRRKPGSDNNRSVVIKDEPDRKQRENRKTYTKKYEEITPEIFTGRQPAWQPKKRTISEKLSRTIEIIMTIY